MTFNGLPIPRKALENIKPYVPGKPIEEVERELGIKNVIKMASNENPLGPSPKAMDAIGNSLSKLNLYPDGASHHLRLAIAEKHSLAAEQVIVGNGSDEIIKLIAETYINLEDEAIMAKPTFSEYNFAITLMGGKCVYVDCVDFSHDLSGMLAAITPKTKVIFICNPNNPTGTFVDGKQIEKFIAQIPEHIVVVFDEAYYEYVDHPEYVSGLEYVLKGYKNVIVLRTFSKIYGLSGLRVGYGLGHPDLIAWIGRAREPFNVNLLAQIGAQAAIRDKEFLEKSREQNAAGRAYLYEFFKDMGFKYMPTQANFIWVCINTECRPVFQALLQEGVIIRTGDIFGFSDHIRVTIGTEEQNKRFAKALKKVLKELAD
jgi:histidinol-phosphate aminotransferase